MPPAERQAYEEHPSAIMIQNNLLKETRMEGELEGRKEGIKEL